MCIDLLLLFIKIRNASFGFIMQESAIRLRIQNGFIRKQQQKRRPSTKLLGK